MSRSSPFSPEVQERAIRLVAEQTSSHGSQWAAVRSVADKLGCHPETLRNWLRRHERDTGQRPGPTTSDAARLTELERENCELRRANEILKKASAYFAQGQAQALDAQLLRQRQLSHLSQVSQKALRRVRRTGRGQGVEVVEVVEVVKAVKTVEGSRGRVRPPWHG
jgi:transposase-like protein